MCTQQKARCLKNINLSICIPMATKIIKRSPRALNEMQSDLKKIGERIKQLRKKAGYSSLEKLRMSMKLTERSMRGMREGRICG
jgi:hypothetical protein